MRVGILTFHEGLNHGAYLQAFATMRVLQGMGHKVEIINYKNRQHWLNEDVYPWFKYRRPVRFMDHWEKHRAFKRDLSRLVLSPFTTDPDEVRKRHYEVVVVGSDVVWNYKIFGYDDLYFGGVNADRIISYAPSFGWANAEEEIPEAAIKGLSRFDAISVRDENSRRIINSVLGLDTPVVLDPTLIYDFASDEVLSKRVDKLAPYLLVYAYGVTDETIRIAKAYAKTHGLKTVATGYRQDWCDKNMMGIGPLEWLALMRKAHTVLTSTFHGTIFALKFSKMFFCISSARSKSRIVSLLDRFGVENKLMYVKENQVELIDPQYEAVSPRLASAARPSIEWLQEALRA